MEFVLFLAGLATLASMIFVTWWMVTVLALLRNLAAAQRNLNQSISRLTRAAERVTEDERSKADPFTNGIRMKA